MSESVNTVRVQAPLAHQTRIIASAKSRKVLRAGRRFGKTRALWYAALLGHGPDKKHWRMRPDGSIDQWEGPLFRGIAQGKDVVWVVPDFSQGRILWFEEVRPRLGDCKVVKLNESTHRVTFPGGVSFWLASAEAIEAVRGAGSRLGGVIVDEAAKMDLGYALRGVILPALLDNNGWLMVASTTNAAKDGDKKWPTGPSYFNRLCEVLNGAPKQSMGFSDAFDLSKWEEFYGTAYDNLKLSPEAVLELETMYPEGSVDHAQEIHARLGATPAGVAFPEWRDDLIRTAPDFRAPDGWKSEVGMDWGFSSPGWAGYHQFGPDGRIHMAFEFLFNGHGGGGWAEENRPPEDIGRRLGRRLMECGHPLPRRIVADIPDELNDGRGGLWHESIKEAFERGLKASMGSQTPPVYRQDKGPQSRAARKLKTHELIAYKEIAGKVPPWCMPKLSVHPSCTYFLRTVPRLPLDADEPDKVDTTGQDHGFDGASGLWISRPVHAQLPTKQPHPDNNDFKPRRPVHMAAVEGRYTRGGRD